MSNFWGKVKNEPVIFLFTRMWKYGEGNRHWIVFFLILSIIGHLIWLLPPLVFGKILNEIQINGLTNLNFNYVLLLIGSLFLVDLGGWIFHGPSRYIENTTAFRIDRMYKKYLYNAVLSLPLTWHSDHDSGDTIDKVNKSTQAIFDFSRHSFNVVKVLVQAIGTTIVIMYFNFYIGLLAVTLLLVSFIIIFRFDLKLIPMYKERNLLDNRASAKVYDSISNVTSIKVLAIENPILASIRNSWERSYDIYAKTKLLVEVKWFVGGMIFTTIVVLPLLIYIWYQYTNNIPILVGTISTLYLYLNDMQMIYFTFAGMYEEMIADKVKVQNVEEVEREFENKSSYKRKVFPDWKNIHITNLNFNYDLGNGNVIAVLQDFDFEFKKGEKIAVIGESGSGKSTLLKVIHGMYENTFANLKIDNKEIKDFDLAKLDIASTLVPQEPEVFSASILENLTLLLDFKKEEIEKCLRISEFEQVVDDLPKGLESVINEKGVNLSGGQKQRLALARAILFAGNKKLILLDESTSSVDPTNEVKIYENIFSNFKDATIIASIHKMNLLKYFDRIIIMKNGKVENYGSFDYLLSANESFKSSWEEYIKNYKEIN